MAIPFLSGLQIATGSHDEIVFTGTGGAKILAPVEMYLQASNDIYLMSHSSVNLTLGDNTATFAGNIRTTEDIGRDDHNRIMFSTDDSLIFRVADSHRFRMDSDNFSPYVDSSYDLGTSAKRWANLWVDNINGATPVTGGPYLPLAAGSGYPLQGSLHFNSSVRSIVWPHTSGQTSSRSWAFIGEQGAYGRFELRRSDAADNTPDTTVLKFDQSNATFTGDVLAPIFYDSNDTNYFLNPAGTATSLKVAGAATFAGKLSVGGTHTASHHVHIKNTSGDNRGIMIEQAATNSYAELAFKSDLREFRLGTGGDGTNNVNAENLFYIYDATTGGTAGHRFEINSDGDVQARRVRSNTAGDVALSLQPTDSTIHYGFRIDSSTNSFNLDRVDSAGQLLRVTAAGNATFAGTVTGTYFYGDGSNLTGISASAPSNMVTTDTSQTISGDKTFTGSTSVGELITTNHIYGRSVNNSYSKLYRFGGLYLTWDSDSYGTAFEHSLTSSYGGTFNDSITLNSYNHIRFNIDSNNNNGTSYFEVGDGTTGTGNVIFRLSQNGNVNIYGTTILPEANSQIKIGTFTDGSSNSGIYDDDDILIGDGGSISIFPHRRGDYGLDATTATSTTFRSKLNIWSDNEDHITFGGASTHMVSAWESWKIWINNDSTSAGTLHLYNKNNKVEFGRLSGNGSSFVLGTFDATSDLRAPIFYDRANTAYYIDPANTSLAIKVAGEYSADVDHGNSGFIQTWRNTNTGGGAYVEHVIGQSGSSELRVGHAPNYGASDWNASWVYAVGKPLFLKSSSNDVVIYAGGAGVNDVVATFDTNRNTTFSGDVEIGTSTNNGELTIRSLDSSSSTRTAKLKFNIAGTDTTGFTLHNNTSGIAANTLIYDVSGTEKVTIYGDGHIRTVNNVTAQIFRDQDNTAYYLDASNASTSLNAAGTATFAGTGTSKFGGDLRLESGTSGTTAKLILKTTDNSDVSKYIRTNAYWNEYGAHANEGHKFVDSSGNILLQLNGGNSNSGNGAKSATFIGDVVISSAGTGGSPALRINNLNHTTFNHGIEVYNGNLVQGESEIILVGKSGSTKNSGYLGYYWHANGSDDNFVSIGHFANNHLLRVYGSGTVLATGNMQAPLFYDSDNTGYYVNPSSGSVLNEISIDDYIYHNGDTDTYLYFETDSIKLRTGGTDRLTLTNTETSFSTYTSFSKEVTDGSGDAIKGYRLNKATSSSWAEGGTGAQTGWYGGNFGGSEITTKWVDGPHGERTLAAETSGDTNNDYDGGYVKAINNLDINKAHLSIVYIKRISSEGTGNVYHGTGAGTNQITDLSGNSNTNPYFHYPNLGSFPQDVWCVSIGVIQANNDDNTTAKTGSGDLQGIYRCDTGQKIMNSSNAWKMGSAGSTLNNGIRFFHYYSTNANAKLQFAKPGFYEINGDEPSLAEILTGGNRGLHTNGGDVTANKFYDWANTSYWVDPAGTSAMNDIEIDDYIYHKGDTHTYFGFTGNDAFAMVFEGTTRLSVADSTDPVFLYNAHINMSGKDIDQVNQLHFQDNVRFVDNGNDSTLDYKYGDTGYGQIKFKDGNNNATGTVYAESGYFGTLSPDQSWAVQSSNAFTNIHHYLNVNDSVRTPIFYDKDNTSYYADLYSSDRAVRTYGSVSIGTVGHLGFGDYTHPKIVYPGKEASWDGQGTTTGQIVIDLPGTLANYDMMYMEIDIYEYSGAGASKLIIGGHNWNTGGNSNTSTTQWYNVNVQVIGALDKPIYFGRRNDGTNERRCIAIGETNSSWSYATVHVAKVHGACYYNDSIDYMGDWNVAQTTSGSYFTKNPTTNFNNSGTYTLESNGIIEANHTYGSTSARAPIFYDLNDTGYYVDPSATGTSLNIKGKIQQFCTDGNIFLGINHSGNENWEFKCESASGSTDFISIGASGGDKVKIYEDGKFEHKGLQTLSSGTSIDQVKEFAMTFQLAANTWTDTGIDGTDLATGTYAMQVYVNDYGVGGQHYGEYYSATISWYESATNSTNVDEIIVHRAGHAPNAGDVQFRTQRALGTDSHDLMLQVKHNIAYNAALDNGGSKIMRFKFRRLI